MLCSPGGNPHAPRKTQLEARAEDMRDPVTKQVEMALIRYNPKVTEMEVRRWPDWRPRRSRGDTGMEDREREEQRDRLMARRRSSMRQICGQDGCTISPRRGTSERGPEGKGQQRRPLHGLERPGLGTLSHRAAREAGQGRAEWGIDEGKAKRGQERRQCRPERGRWPPGEVLRSRGRRCGRGAAGVPKAPHT